MHFMLASVEQKQYAWHRIPARMAALRLNPIAGAVEMFNFCSPCQFQKCIFTDPWHQP